MSGRLHISLHMYHLELNESVVITVFNQWLVVEVFL